MADDDASSIQQIDHDGTRHVLRITFAGGTTLSCLGDPSAVRAGVMNVAYPGAFDLDHIRSRFQRL